MCGIPVTHLKTACSVMSVQCPSRPPSSGPLSGWAQEVALPVSWTWAWCGPNCAWLGETPAPPSLQPRGWPPTPAARLLAKADVMGKPCPAPETAAAHSLRPQGQERHKAGSERPVCHHWVPAPQTEDIPVAQPRADDSHRHSGGGGCGGGGPERPLYRVYQLTSPCPTLGLARPSVDRGKGRARKGRGGGGVAWVWRPISYGRRQVTCRRAKWA